MSVGASACVPFPLHAGTHFYLDEGPSACQHIGLSPILFVRVQAHRHVGMVCNLVVISSHTMNSQESS